MSTESGVGTTPIVGRSPRRLTSAVALLVVKFLSAVSPPCNLPLRPPEFEPTGIATMTSERWREAA